MNRLALPLILASLVATSELFMVPCAAAQGVDAKANAEELAQQAFTKYQAGDFPAAVGLYMKAYELTVDSRILFNVAQIYDKKVQDRDLAIEYYRRYLKSTTTEPDLVAKATERITELGRQQAAEPIPAPTATPTATAATTAPQAAPPAPPASADGAKEDSPPFFIGWIVAGALGAGAVVTGVLALDASSEADALTYTGAPPPEADDTASNATALAAVTDVLIASAVVAGGVTLVLQLTHSPGEAPKTASFLVVPVVDENTVGAVVSGAF